MSRARYSRSKLVFCLALSYFLSASWALAGSISGSVRDAVTQAPLVGFDVDVFDDQFQLEANIVVLTGPDGSYHIDGVDGDFYIRVDATAAQGYADQFWPGSFEVSGAGLVSVASATQLTGVDFALVWGVSLRGVVMASDTALPLAGQPYVDRYYGGATDLGGALLVRVTKGARSGGVDFSLERQGVISGRITDAVTGLATPGIDLDLLTPAGGNFPNTNPRRISTGATRSDPCRTVPISCAPIQGPPIRGSISTTPVDSAFPLPCGGWIRGTITSASSGLGAGAIDLDLFFGDGEPIPSVNADSDAFGQYRIGPMPTGLYLLRADPDPATGLALQYWSGADQIASATPMQVLVGLETTAIEFALLDAVATAVPAEFGARWSVVQAPAAPNPFAATTSLHLRRGRLGAERLEIFDVRGRRVRSIRVADVAPGEEFLLQWDGRDDGGRELASGNYLLRLGAESGAPVLKITRVR